MSEAKHTPGPWSVTEALGTGNFYKIEKKGLMVKVYGKDFYTPAGERVRVKTTEANARLIAAAPDMLDALVQILDGMKNAPKPGEPHPETFATKAIDAIRAGLDAIAKARGA